MNKKAQINTMYASLALIGAVAAFAMAARMNMSLVKKLITAIGTFVVSYFVVYMIAGRE